MQKEFHGPNRQWSFDCFKSNFLTLDRYVEIAKELYGVGGEANDRSPSIVIYEIVHSSCKEQRSIVDNGVHLSVLSSTLEELPQLTDVGLSFCGATELKTAARK
jgi:hypothetical protein